MKPFCDTRLTPPAGPQRATQRSYDGFSLVEIMIVVVIIGTFAAIAIPRYANSLTRYRADATARRIVADLALTQGIAKQSSASKTVHFMMSSKMVHLIAIPGLDDPSIDYKT